MPTVVSFGDSLSRGHFGDNVLRIALRDAALLEGTLFLAGLLRLAGRTMSITASVVNSLAIRASSVFPRALPPFLAARPSTPPCLSHRPHSLPVVRHLSNDNAFAADDILPGFPGSLISGSATRRSSSMQTTSMPNSGITLRCCCAAKLQAHTHDNRSSWRPPRCGPLGISEFHRLCGSREGERSGGKGRGHRSLALPAGFPLRTTTDFRGISSISRSICNTLCELT